MELVFYSNNSMLFTWIPKGLPHQRHVPVLQGICPLFTQILPGLLLIYIHILDRLPGLLVLEHQQLVRELCVNDHSCLYLCQVLLLSQ